MTEITLNKFYFYHPTSKFGLESDVSPLYALPIKQIRNKETGVLFIEGIHFDNTCYFNDKAGWDIEYFANTYKEITTPEELQKAEKLLGLLLLKDLNDDYQR